MADRIDITELQVLPTQQEQEADIRHYVDVKQDIHKAQLELDELNRRKGGRPKGRSQRKGRGVARRVNLDKTGVINMPQEILQNHTLKDVDVRVYGMVRTLEWKLGYMWASQVTLAKIMWEEPEDNLSVNTWKKRGTKVGRSLRRLEEAGYIQRGYKSRGPGDTDKWRSIVK